MLAGKRWHTDWFEQSLVSSFTKLWAREWETKKEQWNTPGLVTIESNDHSRPKGAGGVRFFPELRIPEPVAVGEGYIWLELQLWVRERSHWSVRRKERYTHPQPHSYSPPVSFHGSPLARTKQKQYHKEACTCSHTGQSSRHSPEPERCLENIHHTMVWISESRLM